MLRPVGRKRLSFNDVANATSYHSQVASRYGVTGLPVFQRAVRASRMGRWDKNGEKFVFKVTFVTTLMLATFVHF